MNQTDKQKYFSWPDAWVFTALYMTHENGNSIDFTSIIAAGDALNHAIMTNEEIKTAFMKLQSRGIIEIDEDVIAFTDIGENIRKNAVKVKGGMFSRIDISLRKLNSNRVKLPTIVGIEINDEITEDRIRGIQSVHKNGNV